jgi:hypothetical protein
VTALAWTPVPWKSTAVVRTTTAAKLDGRAKRRNVELATNELVFERMVGISGVEMSVFRGS